MFDDKSVLPPYGAPESLQGLCGSLYLEPDGLEAR